MSCKMVKRLPGATEESVQPERSPRTTASGVQPPWGSECLLITMIATINWSSGAPWTCGLPCFASRGPTSSSCHSCSRSSRVYPSNLLGVIYHAEAQRFRLQHFDGATDTQAATTRFFQTFKDRGDRHAT